MRRLFTVYSGCINRVTSRWGSTLPKFLKIGLSSPKFWNFWLNGPLCSNLTSPFIVIMIIAASAMLVMKVQDYSALKLILVLNLTMEAAIMKLSASRLGLVVTTVRVIMVSVVMDLCVLQ